MNCVNDRNQIWFNSFHFISFRLKRKCDECSYPLTHTRTSCCDESKSDFRIMVTKFLRSSSEWLFKWEGKTQMEFCKSFTRHTISFIKRTNPTLTTEVYIYAIQIHFHHISHCDLAEFFLFQFLSSCTAAAATATATTSRSPSSVFFSRRHTHLFHLKNVYILVLL